MPAHSDSTAGSICMPGPCTCADHAGTVVFHKNLPSRPEAFLRAIEPFCDNLVVGVECMFAWYWVADLCVEHNIAFVLGHVLYMKAIHGGKAKNDRIDAGKI